MADDLRHFLAEQTSDRWPKATVSVTRRSHPPHAPGVIAGRSAIDDDADFGPTAHQDRAERLAVVRCPRRRFLPRTVAGATGPGRPARQHPLLEDAGSKKTDADNTFSVGLIYGPSGCGKSSLVKAGLLPRLSDDVIAVYVEATAEETETRLLNGLRKRCPALARQPGSERDAGGTAPGARASPWARRW